MQDLDSESRYCPDCEAIVRHPSIQQQTFTYGVGADAVELQAQVRVWSCACGFEFTAGDAEEARHAAVWAHLKTRIVTGI